jgi:predicted RNA binding protein YcfA (HicA-like mRNA interferase family)
MKLPRDLSGSRVASALQRLGFSQARQTGSHIQLAKGSLRVTVPNHDPIAPGTLKSIPRQSSIELDELLANL